MTTKADVANETPLELITRFRQYADTSFRNKYEPADVLGNGSVWIGSMFDAVNTDWLQEKGITHVVNCADAIASYAKRVTGTTLIREVLVLEAEDDAEYMILDRHLDDVVRFCDVAFRGDPRAKVLFHCMAGVNRSATLGLAYVSCSTSCGVVDKTRLERFADAFVRVMRQRPIILTNDSFYNQLLIWAQL